MIARLKNLSPALVWLICLGISVVASVGIAAGVAVLLRGEVGYDHLLAGIAVSLPLAALGGSLLNSALARRREGEASAVIVEAKPEPRPAAATEAEPAPALIARKAASHAEGRDRNQEHAELLRAIGRLDALPAMPVIAQKLLELQMDTEEGERKLLELVEQDPQISAKILGLANSAMIGAARPIRSVREAALLLGNRRVQSVAAGIAIISLMARAPSREFDMHGLWRHSFSVAFTMRSLARAMPADLRPQDEHIFLAGMLHDIGYLALAFVDPRRSDRLHNHLAAQPDRPSLDIEREIVGVCHDELGAELGRHWNLPGEIVAVLRYHHEPDAAGAAEGQPLVRMVNIAEKLLPPVGIVEYVTPEIGDAEWAALGIAPARAEEMRQEAGERAEEAMQLVSSFEQS